MRQFIMSAVAAGAIFGSLSSAMAQAPTNPATQPPSAIESDGGHHDHDQKAMRGNTPPYWRGYEGRSAAEPYYNGAPSHGYEYDNGNY